MHVTVMVRPTSIYLLNIISVAFNNSLLYEYYYFSKLVSPVLCDLMRKYQRIQDGSLEAELHSGSLCFILVGVHFGTDCLCIGFETLNYLKLSVDKCDNFSSPLMICGMSAYGSSLLFFAVMLSSCS